LQGSNGIAGKLDLDVFRNAKLNPVVFESYYRTVNPTGIDDLIARLQVVDHVLKLLLAPPRRQKYDQVKDSKDQDEGQKRNETAGCLRLLLKEHINPHVSYRLRAIALALRALVPAIPFSLFL